MFLTLHFNTVLVHWKGALADAIVEVEYNYSSAVRSSTLRVAAYLSRTCIPLQRGEPNTKHSTTIYYDNCTLFLGAHGAIGVRKHEASKR
jgi:hypothetical protein